MTSPGDADINYFQEQSWKDGDLFSQQIIDIDPPEDSLIR